MFTGQRRYNVVINHKDGGVISTDLLFATDDKQEAISFAKNFPDNEGVEIWTNISEDGYEVVAW